MSRSPTEPTSFCHKPNSSVYSLTPLRGPTPGTRWVYRCPDVNNLRACSHIHSQWFITICCVVRRTRYLFPKSAFLLLFVNRMDSKFKLYMLSCSVVSVWLLSFCYCPYVSLANVFFSYSDIIICFGIDVLFSSKIDVLFVLVLSYICLPQKLLSCRLLLVCLCNRCSFCLQHMRFHMDTVALTYSFYEVISATESAPRPLRELRHRCLNPGQYVHHLERWLTYYKPKQVRLLATVLTPLFMTPTLLLDIKRLGWFSFKILCF